MTKRWHILRDNGALTLARQLPVRFDFAVRTTLGPGDALRLAHQIRQDLWRALQRLRGFSPVVRLEPQGAGWDVTAGGRASGPVPASVLHLAQNVLMSPANQSRWLRHAQKGGRS